MSAKPSSDLAEALAWADGHTCSDGKVHFATRLATALRAEQARSAGLVEALKVALPWVSQWGPAASMATVTAKKSWQEDFNKIYAALKAWGERDG